MSVPDTVVSDLAPGGVLRAAVNLGNPVLAQGTGPDGLGIFREQGLEAAVGISQVIGNFVARNPGFRAIGERFMQIRQAVGTTRTCTSGIIRFLAAAVEDLKASGFIRDALRRSGQDRALAAPPDPPV